MKHTNQILPSDGIRADGINNNIILDTNRCVTGYTAYRVSFADIYTT